MVCVCVGRWMCGGVYGVWGCVWCVGVCMCVCMCVRRVGGVWHICTGMCACMVCVVHMVTMYW